MTTEDNDAAHGAAVRVIVDATTNIPDMEIAPASARHLHLAEGAATVETGILHLLDAEVEATAEAFLHHADAERATVEVHRQNVKTGIVRVTVQSTDAHRPAHDHPALFVALANHSLLS